MTEVQGKAYGFDHIIVDDLTEAPSSSTEGVVFPAKALDEVKFTPNRATRRRFVKSMERDVRLAYGHGRVDHQAPGRFPTPGK